MEDVIDARGTKRTCQSCAGRFYDLNKDPIECPLCGAAYIIASAPPKREAEKPKVEAEKKAEETSEESKTEDEDVELVSLEDAEVDVDDDDDDDDASDTFLEDDDDDSNNVVDIIPTKDNDEES